MTVIKAGYRLTVQTWENDADNYNSGAVEGMTRDEAVFIADFVKLFASRHCHTSRGIGNMYEPDSAERDRATERVKEVVERHLVTIQASDKFTHFLNGGWHDCAYDLTLAGGEFWTRVLDSFRVEYIPEDVHLQDVTKEFE